MLDVPRSSHAVAKGPPLHPRTAAGMDASRFNPEESGQAIGTVFRDAYHHAEILTRASWNLVVTRFNLFFPSALSPWFTVTSFFAKASAA